GLRDLLPLWRGLSFEQRHGGDNHPRRAVAALHRPRVEECLLERVQPVADAQAFDGPHWLVLDRADAGDARARTLAVVEHAARGAIAASGQLLSPLPSELARSMAGATPTADSGDWRPVSARAPRPPARRPASASRLRGHETSLRWIRAALRANSGPGRSSRAP